MNCLNDGVLRAWIDDELAQEQNAAVANHVDFCARCRERVEVLTQRSAMSASLLGSQAVPLGEAQTEAALIRWRRRRQQAPAAVSSHWLDRIAWRPALTVATVLAIFVVTISTSAGRAWAERILTMLRVEKVTTVPVDLSSLSSPEGRSAGQMLARLLNTDLVVTMKPQKPQPVADQVAAARAAGFEVRLPSEHSTPAQLAVGSEAAFQITLHRQSLQAILDEAGRSDLQLPASIDNALVAVHIPRSVVARYGSCPTPDARTQEQKPHHPRAYPGCTVLMEVPSPTVSVPPGLNLQQIAAIGLELTGMSPSEAEQFTKTVDWTSTLVIPVPERIANSAPIAVDGQQGVLIRREGAPPSAPNYQLVWTHRGIIYAIAGWGDPAAAVAMANTLE